MAKANPRRANGHRRDQVRAQVLREEDVCWLCGELVDKTLGLMPGVHSRRCANTDCLGCVPNPRRGEVDEIVPVTHGGDPLDRSNCHLAHRDCNNRRSDGTKRVKVREPLKTSRHW